MPLFDECCVLIPAVTLEDFPSEMSDCDACSLLASWTVLFHPRLLAASEQLPAWYRADAPPETPGRRLMVISAPSRDQLPAGYEESLGQLGPTLPVSGATRAEMIEAIAARWNELAAEQAEGWRELAPLQGSRREVSVDDFFALGYSILQIQVMTRRLRYTSNLDEVHLQQRLVGAANAFLEQDADAAIEAIHDVFDLLAQERDHYFSAADPHLLDLTLASRATASSLVESCREFAAANRPPDSDSDPNETEADESRDQILQPGSGGVLPTPTNVLIDQDVAEGLADLDTEQTADLREAIGSGRIGWAGGGPSPNVCLDAMTFDQAESAITDAFGVCESAVGCRPPVFARFTGGIPSDLVGTLDRLGCIGVIPYDFAQGTGDGDEAKVFLPTSDGRSGVEIQGLMARPMDASSDATFLTLGVRIGEFIDSGDISTAVMAHWPGQSCASFDDLRRAASWSLCLGKFWKLDKYFTDGEQPYHHGTLHGCSPSSSAILSESVEAHVADPISATATEVRDRVVAEQQARVAGMAGIVRGESTTDKQPDDFFASAIVGDREDPDPSHRTSAATLLVNASSAGARETLRVGEKPPDASHVYGVSSAPSGWSITVDVPALGFAIVEQELPNEASERRPESVATSAGSLRRRLLGGPQPIIVQRRGEPIRLQNEFMEVALSMQSAGITGGYSGSVRGNRFSLRLVSVGDHDRGGTASEMKCESIEVTASSPAHGVVEARGAIVSSSGDGELAKFKLRYSLDRGARCLHVAGELESIRPVHGDPWKNYLAARVAVASESPIVRAIVRDKVHRSRSRRVVAPLGVVIDEAERQTLIASGGLPFHRRHGERFVDTLLSVEGESSHQFELCYGFDVPTPVAAARAFIAPTTHVAVQTVPDAPEVGWLLHTEPKGIVVSRIEVVGRNDGRLAALIRVIQTRAQPCKASIRFVRDVEFATLAGAVGARAREWINEIEIPSNDSEANSESSTSQGIAIGNPLEFDGDRVKVPLPGHAVADLLVVFR